jgi:hypothetical protein
MRVRFLLLPLAFAALGACSKDDGVSVNARPPLGGVRFINAVPDGGAVDIRMVDQVEWSASSVTTSANYGLPFRAGTIHWPTEAKARHIRVFPTDSSITVTSTILVDTTITIEADKNVTLLLVGSRAANTLHFVTLEDMPPALSGQQIAVRTVNAATVGQTPGAVDGYVVDTTTTPLPASPSFANVGQLTVSPYVVRDTGMFAVRATETANTATVWSALAPVGAPASGLIGATAGARGAGSALSAFVFPRSTAGTAAPQTAAYTAPAVVFFADKIPTPPTAP